MQTKMDKLPQNNPQAGFTKRLKAITSGTLPQRIMEGVRIYLDDDAQQYLGALDLLAWIQDLCKEGILAGEIREKQFLEAGP